MGWIVLGLLVAGGLIWMWSLNDSGTAEDRMGRAFMGLFGMALAGLGLILLIGHGIWSMF